MRIFLDEQDVGSIVKCTDDSCAKGYVRKGEFYKIDSLGEGSGGAVVNVSQNGKPIPREIAAWRFEKTNVREATDVPAAQVAKKEVCGKPPLDILFRITGLDVVADIFGASEAKYPSVDGDFNWRKGRGDISYQMKLLGAGLRHIYKHMKGEKLDSESGKPHLAHAICDLLMAFDLEEK